MRFGVNGAVALAIWSAGAACDQVEPEDMTDAGTEAAAVYARAMMGMLAGRRCVLDGALASASVLIRPRAVPPGAAGLAPYWADLCYEHFRALHIENATG